MRRRHINSPLVYYCRSTYHGNLHLRCGKARNESHEDHSSSSLLQKKEKEGFSEIISRFRFPVFNVTAIKLLHKIETAASPKKQVKRVVFLSNPKNWYVITIGISHHASACIFLRLDAYRRNGILRLRRVRRQIKCTRLRLDFGRYVRFRKGSQR